MLVTTAYAVATLHILSIPAIHAPAAENDYINQEVKRWFACHVALLSDNRPEARIQTPITVIAHGWPIPSKFYADELLDWDTAIIVAPLRPSGTLSVTLEYAGRGTPSPTRDPWD